MSDYTPGLPDRPSIAQLRKRAKELLQAMRNGDPAATERLRKHKSNVADPILADAQFVLAREHGFESWARLVHHIGAVQNPELDQHRQIAEDLVRVYNAGDVEAAARLNDLFHSELDVTQIHQFIRDRLFNVPYTQQRIDNFTLLDAQLIVAQLYGFKDWDELVRSTSAPATDPYSAPFVLSSKPFY